MLVECGRIELQQAPFLQLSYRAITSRFTTVASLMPLAHPIRRGLMLFNHTERPSEILVVGSFSFLLRQNWATAKGLLP